MTATSIARKVAPQNLRATRQDMLEATEIRNIAGLLTIEETAERYGINVERITNAVDAEQVGSVTLMYEEEGTELVLLPTKDGAVSEWLEAHR